MVEVYHSARLDCAASHELMMNAGRVGERADCCREATEGWTENKNARRRWDGNFRMGSFGVHVRPLCRLLMRSGCQDVDWSGNLFDYKWLIFKKMWDFVSAHPISFLGCVMKQIRPADSAYFEVFLGQALFRDRQGIMGRNTTDERLSYLPFTSTFTHPSSGGFLCIGLVLLKVCSH